MCMRKPVGEDEAIEMNEALAEKRDFTADDLEAFPEDVQAEVIEVASKSTRKRDYGLKMMKYRIAGVKEYWIVDPERETVMVNCFDDECQTCLYSFDDEITFHLFPELRVRVRDLIL